MKTYRITLDTNSLVVSHLLGGLSSAYRTLSLPEHNIELRSAIRNILIQLCEQGVDVMNRRSPYNSYVRLIDFDPENYGIIIKS